MLQPTEILWGKIIIVYFVRACLVCSFLLILVWMRNIQGSNSDVQFKNEHCQQFFMKSLQLPSTTSMISDLISVQIIGTRIEFWCERKCLCTDSGEYDIGEINTRVKTMFFVHEEETLIMFSHMQPSDQSFTKFTLHIPCIFPHLWVKLMLKWQASAPKENVMDDILRVPSETKFK